MIELLNIYKSFNVNHQKLNALSDLTLSVNKGEIFGIFGESGAGKSTLLRLVNLLERPTQGKVIVDGIDLTHLSAHQLKNERRKMGMIFQQFNLLESRTVFENIALPLEILHKKKSDIKHEVLTLLNLVGLSEHQYHYPSQLSGGQKQRVAIARALATRPDILLCDEPTSALDTVSTRAILNLLKQINSELGVTIVIITHEMDVLKQICHRAALLHQGQLIETATIIDLFTHPETLMAKQLLKKYLHIELPKSIKQKLTTIPDPHKSMIVCFRFKGDSSSQPFITTLVKKFNVTINILQANIEQIQDTTIGFTVCELSGDHEAIDKALAYISLSLVIVEVMGYA